MSRLKANLNLIGWVHMLLLMQQDQDHIGYQLWMERKNEKNSIPSI